MTKNICHKCKKVLGNEPIATVDEKKWKYCLGCFKCDKCQQSLGKTVYEKDGNLYCSTKCQNNYQSSGCPICNPLGLSNPLPCQCDTTRYPGYNDGGWDFKNPESNNYHPKDEGDQPSGHKCKKCNKDLTKLELKIMYGRDGVNPDFLCETCFANKDQEREREREITTTWQVWQETNWQR